MTLAEKIQEWRAELRKFASAQLSRRRKISILVMRLDDMFVMHPNQVTLHCARCGHEVGVYPSGQRMLRENPGAELVCQVCQGSALIEPPSDEVLREMMQSRRK